MIYVALIASVAFIPGVLGISLPANWAALSVLLPLAAWWVRRTDVSLLLTPALLLGASFLAYAFFSVAWTVNRLDAIEAIWHLSIIGLAFWIGSTMASIRAVVLGLTIGCGASSALAVAQHFGFHPIMDEGAPSGLFFSRVILGQVLALVCTALYCERLAWLTLPLLPGIFLSGSRGAILGLGFGLAAIYTRPWFLAIAGAAALLAFTFALAPSDTLRLQLWSGALAGLTVFGHGPGSWLGIAKGTELTFGNVHNDYLQLAYEFGLGATPVFGIYAIGLLRTGEAHWPTFTLFAFFALFSFPLYSPIPAFLGALVAGHVTRSWSILRSDFGRGRSLVLQGNPVQ